MENYFIAPDCNKIKKTKQKEIIINWDSPWLSYFPLPFKRMGYLTGSINWHHLPVWQGRYFILGLKEEVNSPDLISVCFYGLLSNLPCLTLPKGEKYLCYYKRIVMTKGSILQSIKILNVYASNNSTSKNRRKKIHDYSQKQHPCQ